MTSPVGSSVPGDTEKGISDEQRALQEQLERPNFEGHEKRECGEHRTVGPHRAWCYDCTEWCYPRPEMACKGCMVPMLQADVEAMVAGINRQSFETMAAQRDELRTVVEGLRAELANEVELRKSYQREVAALRAAGGQEKPSDAPDTGKLRLLVEPHPNQWAAIQLHDAVLAAADEIDRLRVAAPVGGQAEPSDAEDVECVTCRAKVGEHCRSLPDPRYTRNPHGARRAASAGVPFDPETPEAVR